MPGKESIVIGLNAAIVAVSDETPGVLLVGQGRREDGKGLPFGPMDPAGDRTLELGLRGWVSEQTGIDLGYVEQLYTFADRNRDPRSARGGPRVISVAYLALVRRTPPQVAGADWHNIYDYFPWEDRREGPGDDPLHRELRKWAGKKASERRERIDIAFGLGGSPWDSERVLHRYELLYEAGLVAEALRDARLGRYSKQAAARLPGRPLTLDHRRILATALGRLRAKIKYRPVVFELLPPTFTLLQLQRVVEALAGLRLHKQNFRRLVDRGGLVEGTGLLEAHTGGRPAELFRFRREVLRERPAPGVGLPVGRS